MTTIESWAGNIAEIGPIYPFVGSEFLLCAIGFALWIVWFVLQGRMESREYAREIERQENSAQTSNDNAD